MADNQKWNYSGGVLPQLTPIAPGPLHMVVGWAHTEIPLREAYTPMHAMAAVTPTDMFEHLHRKQELG